MTNLDTTDAQSSRRATARRMGTAGSPTWHAILDGAEDILREEGHAALNAKRIAERIDIKRQLVYYYFCDIDDLLNELFHRIANRGLDHLRSALNSPNPLRETWQAGVETFDQTLVWEYLALGHRSERVRKAFLDYAEVAREIQVAALAKVLRGRPMPRVEVPLPALAIITTWVALGLQREAALGITKGHKEVEQFIQEFLSQCEEGAPANAD